jgi:hypothetical protein
MLLRKPQVGVFPRGEIIDDPHLSLLLEQPEHYVPAHEPTTASN